MILMYICWSDNLLWPSDATNQGHMVIMIRVKIGSGHGLSVWYKTKFGSQNFGYQLQ